MERVSSTSNGAAEPRVPNRDYVAMVSAAIDICSARALALIAVLGAVGMFFWAVYDPMPVRSYTVSGYAAVVLWPVILLYLKKG